MITNRKGELTTKQLVTIIILIASFIIILFLVFRLNLGETTDKEICRNSVILKSKSGPLSGPLDCRTNYLCISGSSDCEQITQTSKIEVEPGNKTQIMRALADEMASCWWQFGEGKTNYGDTAIVENRIQYALCSVLAFDEKIQTQTDEITYGEFYNYLKNNKKTNTETYLQYLYGASNLGEIDIDDRINFSLSESLSTSKKYSIITGVDNNPYPLKDKILFVYIIPTDETNTRTSSNKEFITKS